MTGLYWSTLLKSRAPTNICIVVIRCIFNCCFECFHTAVSFCCVYFVTERKARNIYLHIHPNAAQVWINFLWSSVCVFISWIASRRALQRHTGQTAVLLALTLGQMRSNDYSTTKIFVDNFLLSTLSIMSTNRCSPSSNALIILRSTIKQEEEEDASHAGCCESVQDSYRWIRGKKKNNINTVQFLAQTDHFVSLDLNVSLRATGFNLILSVYVFFSLKAVSLIDCHYMTKRLQKFELKIFVCVLL